MLLRRKERKKRDEEKRAGYVAWAHGPATLPLFASGSTGNILPCGAEMAL